MYFKPGTEIDVRILGLVDSRNEKVYHEVANKLLDFKVRHFDERICIFDPLDETIYLCKDARIEDFTHELLHAFIRSKQVYAMGAFEIQLGSYPAIKELFEEPLIDHVTNCIDHIKMLPIYINMGFDPVLFISDGAVPKCTEGEFSEFRRLSNLLPIYPKGGGPHYFRWYVGKYFAMKCCPNKNHDYSTYLNELEEMEPVFFSNLENFYNQWEQYDIHAGDLLAPKSYRNIVADLITAFRVWEKSFGAKYNIC